MMALRIFALAATAAAASSSSCEGPGGATSPALLQKKRKELSRIVTEGATESLYEFRSAYMTTVGTFDMTYDPAVYCCNESHIADMQRRGLWAMKQAIASLAGHGVQPETVTAEFTTDPADHSSVTCHFEFPCPTDPEAMVSHLDDTPVEAIVEHINGMLKENDLCPTDFQVHITKPITSSFKPASTTETTTPVVPMITEGTFDMTYDPAVYCCNESHIADMQRLGLWAMKQAIASLAGHGVHPETVTAEFTTDPADHSSVTCHFEFPCPTDPEAMMSHLDDTTVETIVEHINGMLRENDLDPAGFQVHITKPITSSFKPASTTTAASSTIPSSAEAITGRFTISYDPSVYTGAPEEVAAAQEKSQAAFKLAISEVLGHGVKDEEIELRFEQVLAMLQQKASAEALCFFTFPVDLAEVPVMEEVVQEIDPGTLSSALQNSLENLGVPSGVSVTSAVTLDAPTNPRDSTHGSDSGESTYGDSSYGTTMPSIIEGSFVLSYDLSSFNASEMEHLKVVGHDAVGESLAHLLGIREEIHVHFSDLPAETSIGLLQQNSGVKVSFFFACPQDAAPENMVSAIAEIKEATLKADLDSVMAREGVDVSALHLSVSFLTSTWYYETPSTTATAASSTTTTTTTTAYTLEDVHPCKSFDDFMPDKKMSVHGWCDMTAELSEFACQEAGCEPYGYPDAGYCYCETEALCTSAGLTYKFHTCSEEMSAYMHGEYPSLIQAARERGNCSGLETSWSQPLGDVLEWQARVCCKSWPKKLCDPEAELATPCKDPADFLKSSPFHEGSAGSETCMDVLLTWWEEYAVLEQATVSGCDELHLSSGESVSDFVKHPGKKCCESSPATICEPDLRPMTPCADRSAFQPEKPLHTWCDFPLGIPPTCEESGCTLYGDAGEQHCHCPSASSCEAAGGSWMSYSCQESVNDYGTEMLKALMQADNGTSCDDLSVEGQTLSERISWAVKQCCASFPASICDKDAKKMTPCKSAESFTPSKLLHAYCSIPVPPTEEVCKGQRKCRLHDGHCSCEDSASCVAVGGHWIEETCGNDVEHWDRETHSFLESAAQSGCDATDRHGNKASDYVEWTAKKCCSDWPASVCNPAAELVLPCKDAGDWMPEGVLHEWCEFYHGSPEGCGGCEAHEHGQHGQHGCHCSTSESCEAAGGVWQRSTCADDLLHWPSSKHLALKTALETDSCDGDLDGQSVKDAMDHTMRKCCRSFPATLCDKDAKYMTPCKDEADFRPNEVIHGSHTCGEEVSNWPLDWHKVLQQAEEQGGCSGLSIHGQAVPDAISYTASSCCASFPATTCDPTAKKMTPCQSPGDFKPHVVMWAWCHVDMATNSITADACNAQEGCYGDAHWCHCQDETGCTAIGGTWHSHTCQKEIDQWRPEQHKLLQQAEADGTCLDHDLNGWRAEDMVSWPAQQCCSNYPSTLCDPDVEAMTVCKHKEDFLATKVRHTWCELYPPPSETDCVAQGCTYHNEWYCECPTEASCVGAGGHFHSWNCTAEISWWPSATHKGIKEAIQKGSCDGVMANSWSTVDDTVNWLGDCCSTGKSVCEELSR